MFRNLLAAGIFFSFCVSASAQPTEVASTPGELKKSPEGWTDLLNAEQKGWKRAPIPAAGKLAEKSPWKMDKLSLLCEGKGVHEMLLWDRELADGTFHAEWKFKKATDKKGYASGLYSRNSADGSAWHQVQIGDQNVGYLFGETPVGTATKRFRTETKGRQRGYPPGEWNTTEITAKGKSIAVWHNGYATSEWNECAVLKGYLGVECEGSVIEFRNLKWKEAK